MQFRITHRTIYHCSLERAFACPMRCDIAKVHTGKGLMPRMTHCTEDENWAKVGSSKKVFAAKSLTQKGGFVSVDTVLERVENNYWIIEVNQFQSWLFGFHSFIGEWSTTELSPGKIQIDYTYTLHAKGIFWYPFQWMFARLFWKSYMKQVLNNIRQLAEGKEPYAYE